MNRHKPHPLIASGLDKARLSNHVGVVTKPEISVDNGR